MAGGCGQSTEALNVRDLNGSGQKLALGVALGVGVLIGTMLIICGQIAAQST